MRIALIGAGYMASQHAAAYAAMPDVEIAAVVGAGPERAERLARPLGARGTTDLRAVLADDEVTAVDVTVPTARHDEVVTAALTAGKHVFCETPLAATAGEAVALRERAREAECHLQVALLMRVARPAVDLQDKLLSGALGRLRVVSMRRLAPGTSGAHHGDVLEEIMLFDLDVLCWSLGTPRGVHASAVEGPTGRLDHAVVTLDWGSVRAWCEASYLLARAQPFTSSLLALGDDGVLEGTFQAARDGPPTIEVRLAPRGGEPDVSTDLGAEPVGAECRHFVQVVRGEADPALLDVEQAIAGLRVLDAARASLADDRWHAPDCA